MNYRFYDYLLPYINENMQPDMKGFFNEMNKLNLRRINDDRDLYGYIKHKLGINRIGPKFQKNLYFERDISSFQE